MEFIKTFYEDVKTKLKLAKFILVGNKIDLERDITFEEANYFAT